LTAFELNSQLVAKSVEVDQAVAEYKLQARVYADAKHASEMDQAVAYPSTKGTVRERETAVYRLCGDSILLELRAEALRNSADRALKAHMAQLSALQSMAAALRQELALARTDNYS
jgi:hypothetical protein